MNAVLMTLSRSFQLLCSSFLLRKVFAGQMFLITAIKLRIFILRCEILSWMNLRSRMNWALNHRKITQISTIFALMSIFINLFSILQHLDMLLEPFLRIRVCILLIIESNFMLHLITRFELFLENSLVVVSDP
jgi:hypothetical protein